MAREGDLPFDPTGLSVEDMVYLEGALDQVAKVLRAARYEHRDPDRAEEDLRRIFRKMISDGYSEQAEQIFTSMLLALSLARAVEQLVGQQLRRSAARQN